MLTLSKAEFGLRRPKPIRQTEGGEFDHKISIRQQPVGGKPQLLYSVIKVRSKHLNAAWHSPCKWV